MSVCPHEAKDRIDAVNSPEAVALRVAETQRSIDQGASPKRRDIDDPLDIIINASMRPVRARLVGGQAKHGVYEALSTQERLAKILRHAGKELSGDMGEDHWAAIAGNALLAIEARRRQREEIGG